MSRLPGVFFRFHTQQSTAGQQEATCGRENLARQKMNLIAAASPASAAASTPVTAAISATAPAVASTASGVLSLRTRFIYIESASTDLRAIQCSNSLVSLFVVRHLDRTESAR